ncbi:hypothetical protein INR76_05715 [Marixanthomonas sp. SCSIO 43207]|uniref:hypothetical protein n=1 Tax=Marixanthomonas sp. SCSIO 43207 TaxID=2779360 RepID=UPI001CA995D7|nr:hypothetical protein [Marixanthomonas sp. SCSIO 43207]UAB82257.1 hypothetical protein INR76_05715 [Marixanthomonas sp. SCSIO 43207]
MKKVYFLIILLITVIISCKNLESNKKDFICKNGSKTISVEMENGQDFLIYDKVIKTNFVCKNVDPVGLLIQGAGIRLVGSKNKNIMRTEIKVPSNYLEKDTLTIMVRYGENYKKECEFNIPIKESE